MNFETKQEGSVSVQSRVNVIDLGDLTEWWGGEGIHIKNMSQLVSWSISLLCEILETNEKMKRGNSVAEAYNKLDVRGLLQKSFKDRNMKKISTAMRFESMRDEGFDPRQVQMQYNVVHNKASVKPWMGSVEVGDGGRDLTYLDEAYKRIAEEKKKEIAQACRDNVELARQSGSLVQNRLKVESSIPERDKGIIARENQDIDPDFIRNLMVKE